jgi:dTDP-4-dehydrorhamnose 3,5-epimerase
VKLVSTSLDGGLFARTWDRAALEERGLEARVEQASLAYNDRAGTLRGLHFQVAPHEEVKIVRCTRGAIHDVIVDLRPASPTYLGWLAVELTADNRVSLYVPRGFAHGYQTLTDGAEVAYLISEPYAPASAGGVRYDDPALGIVWPSTPPALISARDLEWPDYEPDTRRTRGT